MTSICNYSHPELQLTDGLVPQGSGALFPYNPEMYERVSGLYGPGTIYCWHLIIASFLLAVIFRAVVYAREGRAGFERDQGVSSDLLAVVAYPVFAATDLTIQGMRNVHLGNRALAICCLRYPGASLNDLGYTFGHTPLDMREPIPPDVLDLGQRVVDMMGPIAVCYTFAFVAFAILVTLVVLERNHVKPGPWRPSSMSLRLVVGSYGYVVLALIVFHLSVGDLVVSFVLFLYEALTPLQSAVAICLALVFLAAVLGSAGVFAGGLWARDRKKMGEGLGMAAKSFFWGFLILTPFLFLLYANPMRPVPDVAVRLAERDQLATLLVGVVTLAYTVSEVVRYVWELRQASLRNAGARDVPGAAEGVEQVELLPVFQSAELGATQRQQTW
ncbi:hypothetical protein B0T24DRAFT_641704 [Lasiosphaeria ovina]|uniref:Uncharacterized protein n=1 Tax=Lasiosphaeria ovina TaxID=92902 RepID=A0AAE0JTB9_9PEZI|nr:hypothetical protein B0T24DRAFT_641704 [Lasiosphaeria ovina]